MNGREELQIKTFKQVEAKCKKMPKYVMSWYQDMRLSEKTASTCLDSIYKVDKFLRTINKDDIKDIGYNDVSLYLSTEFTNPDGTEKSVAHKKATRAALNSFFDAMVKYGYTKENYIAKVPKIKASVNIPDRALQKNEIYQIMDVIPRDTVSGIRDRAIFALFMRTGMRCSALTQININDIKDDGSLVVIDKGNKKCEYMLNNTIDIINEWKTVRDEYAVRGKSKALFLSNRGGRISAKAIEHMIQKYGYQALNKKISPHWLRHGFAIAILDQTHNIEDVRYALHHSQISTTQRYFRNDQYKKEFIAKAAANAFQFE